MRPDEFLESNTPDFEDLLAQKMVTIQSEETEDDSLMLSDEDAIQAAFDKEESENNNSFSKPFATFNNDSSQEDLDEEPVIVPAVNQSLKGRIEAMLFMTNRALQVAEIAEKLSAHYDDVEGALIDLIQDYSFREESSLEINDTDGYILQVRSDYQEVVNLMLPVEISPAVLRTLSAIALRGPILQSKLVELRGSGVYDHIKVLLKEKLVAKSRQQQSYMLKVTPKFHEYFRLEASEMNKLLASAG